MEDAGAVPGVRLQPPQEVDPVLQIKLQRPLSQGEPGALQFEVDEPPEGGGSRLTQTVFFEPKGLTGTVYWHVVLRRRSSPAQCQSITSC